MILCLCPNPSVDKFIWIKDFNAGKVNRVEEERSFAGGKGVHVALGLAELGETCALLGFWGGDTGRFIKQYCESKGISCYGPDIDEANRTCFTFRSPGHMDGTELLTPGPFITESQIELFRSAFTSLSASASTICMSGSWPRTAITIDYSWFIATAKQNGVESFVDCSGKSLLEILDAKPYCIHINQHEGLDTFNEEEPLNIASRLLRNCELAAVTRGADGLWLCDKNHGAVHTCCRLDSIISAVGSGDSLVAGLAAAHSRKLTLANTAILSTACGTANCLREDLGMFYKKDVDELMAKVAIVPLYHDQPV